ncbi:MAG TPA: hypothetical protein V6D11_08025 [Waterburya sp.]|jgi:hypothetical protein
MMIDTLRGIVGNLAVLRYLVVKERKYKRRDIERLLDTIDELLVTPNNLSTKGILIFQQDVAECITLLEERNQEEKSQEQRREIDAVLQRLHQILEKCQQMQGLQQLV